MPRDTDALRIRKWAEHGNRTLPEENGLDRSLGYTPDFSQIGGKTPTREVLNQILAEFSGMLEEINAHGGGLPWDARVAYKHPALVLHTDGHVYVSLRDTLNENPTTIDSTAWRRVDD